MKSISLIAGMLLFLAPGWSQSHYSYHSSSSNNGIQEGPAVYYADYLHGKRTAMGEVYRMEEFTAAHKTLPQNTLVKVTRLDNGQAVVVRINDRGPFDPEVIIDLSKAAAMKIGLVKKGRARVQLETVGQSATNPPNGALPGAATSAYANSSNYSNKGAYGHNSRPAAPAGYTYGSAPKAPSYNYNGMTARGGVEPYPSLPTTAGGYAVQLASYRNLDNARNQLRQLEQRGLQNLYIWQRNGYHKIVVASFASKSAAAAHLEQLRRQALQDGIVVKIK